MSCRYLILMAAIAIATSASTASASVQFYLNQPFSSDPGGPTGQPATLATVTIFDSTEVIGLSPNQALIVVDGSLAPNTDLSELTLNFDDGSVALFSEFESPLGPNFLNVEFQSGVGVAAVSSESILVAENGASIDSTTGWDIKIDFNLNDFDGTDQATFKVTYSGGSITANQFVSPNAGIGGPWRAAGRIETSAPGLIPGYIGDGPPDDVPPPAVPEPTTLAIWGLGLGIAGLVRLRNKK